MKGDDAVEWYDILSLVLSCIGFPTVCVIAYKSLYKRIKDADIKRTATQEGIQALLRAQMISEYNKALDKGYAAIYAKQNFENVWKKYHSLGVNGVMDDIHDKYMDLPDRKELLNNEHKLESKN
ncbi:MAG TPA: hypothetical protein IAA61_00040 [Candidatus Ornithomonoglobus merdipullorum]|jgi:hypothetical protein|uniref:Uncharacterized protein n=1 Tax=Candidatus Ornithomonoglobus merdipullorum TaxID=2840895 RepID=A0A9D1SDJ1_9FIRM|nr:MAG TPA: hypothetical protein [Caudoviricetes sp.]HIU56181.1 hypothetical protein [Candidatus Ornithomonoglobus merdipullorum]